MAQIATFKLTEQEKLEQLAEQLTPNATQLGDLLEDMENEGQELPDGGLSGDIFTALFDYLEAENEMNCCDMGDFMELQDAWMEIREPADFRIFTYEKAQELLQALEEEMAADIAEGWELAADDVSAGLKILESNLGKVDDTHCLLYFLH